MPSFKSCIASLAVLAMTIAPIASGKGVHADALAGRDMNVHQARAVSSPQAGSNVDKRAAAKAAAAARALARREAKAAANASPARVAPTRGASTASAVTASTYNRGSAFMIAAALAVGPPRRCGSDQACVNQYPVPANAYAVCDNGCGYRCKDTFTPMSDGSCQQPTGCGVCPTVASGYAICQDGTCVPKCYDDATLYANGAGNYACYYTLTDRYHCGPKNAPRLRACNTVSYNGVGTPSCVGGTCSLDCPYGTNLYPAKSITNPNQCQ